MKVLSGTYFLISVRYPKTLEDGTETKTTEQYIVEALSWTECEAKAIDEMSAFVSGELEITAMKKAGFSELFLSGMYDEDKYYDCCINMIVLDEKSGKEKKSKVRYLVQGKSFENAKKNVDEAMKGTMVDYEIASLKETSVIDIFRHEKKENS